MTYETFSFEIHIPTFDELFDYKPYVRPLPGAHRIELEIVERSSFTDIKPEDTDVTREDGTRVITNHNENGTRTITTMPTDGGMQIDYELKIQGIERQKNITQEDWLQIELSGKFKLMTNQLREKVANIKELWATMEDGKYLSNEKIAIRLTRKHKHGYALTTVKKITPLLAKSLYESKNQAV